MMKKRNKSQNLTAVCAEVTEWDGKRNLGHKRRNTRSRRPQRTESFDWRRSITTVATAMFAILLIGPGCATARFGNPTSTEVDEYESIRIQKRTEARIATIAKIEQGDFIGAVKPFQELYLWSNCTITSITTKADMDFRLNDVALTGGRTLISRDEMTTKDIGNVILISECLMKQETAENTAVIGNLHMKVAEHFNKRGEFSRAAIWASDARTCFTIYNMTMGNEPIFKGQAERAHEFMEEMEHAQLVKEIARVTVELASLKKLAASQKQDALVEAIDHLTQECGRTVGIDDNLLANRE